MKKRAAKGDIGPLQKIVEGRSKRRYRDKKKAIIYFVDELGLPREEVVDEVPPSPAQMEKILRKHGYSASELPDLLAPVVEKPPGKPSLVSKSDRRPPISEIDDVIYRDLINPETETEED